MAMTPGVVDMNKKVEEMTPLQNSAGVPNQGSATPDVMHTPLFTEEQVRDMVMLQTMVVRRSTSPVLFSSF